MGSVCSSVDDVRQARSEVAGSESNPSVHITAYSTGNAVPEISGVNTNSSILTPLGNEKDRETGEDSVADVAAKFTEARLVSEDGPKHEDNKTLLIDNDKEKLDGSPTLGLGGNSSNSCDGKETSGNKDTSDDNDTSKNSNYNTKETPQNGKNENCLMDVDDHTTPIKPEEQDTPAVFSDIMASSQDVDNDSGVDGEDIDDIVMADLDFHDDGMELLDVSVGLVSSRDADVKMNSLGELAITKPAPDFECEAVVNGTFQQVKLSSYRGRYVVLFFYPLDFTFVCPTEIIAFSEKAEEFRAINCEILGCSTDSVYSHLAWIDKPRKEGGLGPMKIPLLADRTQEVSRKYGCLKPDEGVAFRALYIIDDKGNLRQITMNDLPVGRSVDETLRLVQAFQFTDKYGEVCPAGWKPGKATMKPTPEDSQKFFNKAN